MRHRIAPVKPLSKGSCGLAAALLLWAAPAGAASDDSEFSASEGDAVVDLGDTEEEDLNDRIQNWILFAAQIDNVWLPAITEACSSTAASKCYYGDGVQRIVGAPAPSPGTLFAEPGAVNASTGERVGAGDVAANSIATSHLLLGFDRVFLRNLTGGMRFGLTVGGAPSGQPDGVKSFFPFYGEVGVGYWFGSDPFARKGIRPFMRLAVGMVHVQEKATTTIIDMRQSDFDPNIIAPANGANPTLEVWRDAGTFFGSASLGAMYAIRPKHGPLVELKAMALFPDSATGVAAQIGYSIGF